MNQSFSESASHATRKGPRPAPGRLAAIAEAAARVFTRQGFRLSQVADVAREAGVAAGTVYLYAADKAALLDLAIRSAAGLPLQEDGEGPIQPDLPATLSAAIGPRLALPRITAAAASEADISVTPRALLEELYDLLAREARLILLLDRLGAEVPEIRRAYAAGLRDRARADFAAAVAHMAARGMLRQDLDTRIAARAVLEMVAWMAMRRPRDADASADEEALARETTLRLGEAALSAPTRRDATMQSRGARPGG